MCNGAYSSLASRSESSRYLTPARAVHLRPSDLASYIARTYALSDPRFWFPFLARQRRCISPPSAGFQIWSRSGKGQRRIFTGELLLDRSCSVLKTSAYFTMTSFVYASSGLTTLKVPSRFSPRLTIPLRYNRAIDLRSGSAIALKRYKARIGSAKDKVRRTNHL